MASAGANNAASSSRGAPLPPLPFPFSAAAHFPSRVAVPFLPQQHHPPATSDGDDEVDEDEGGMDDDNSEEDEAELVGPQQRRASSAPALRLAVQAFKREEESAKALKRRRERLEQDKCGNDDSNPTDLSRGKGVQFPFAVFDRVIIKGNKRTPKRFVGRQAVVTAQCLNGWYVVKTLDNAESVKLQYRSLAKVGDADRSSAMVSSNAQSASWL
nr:unnamed protein product [Digitaria exilis]